MAEHPKPTNLTACPICGKRMELLSRQAGYVSAGCAPCHLSLSIAAETWDQAKAQRAAIKPRPGQRRNSHP